MDSQESLPTLFQGDVKFKTASNIYPHHARFLEKWMYTYISDRARAWRSIICRQRVVSPALRMAKERVRRHVPINPFKHEGAGHLDEEVVFFFPLASQKEGTKKYVHLYLFLRRLCRRLRLHLLHAISGECAIGKVAPGGSQG